VAKLKSVPEGDGTRALLTGSDKTRNASLSTTASPSFAA